MPDALRQTLGTLGYSQRPLAPIMRNVDAAGKVRADLDDFQADFPGTSAVVTDQGQLSIRAERGALARPGDFIDAAKEFAGQRGLTVVVRARAVTGAGPYLLARGSSCGMTRTMHESANSTADEYTARRPRSEQNHLRQLEPDTRDAVPFIVRIPQRNGIR